MDIYHLWIYVHIINTEWFVWGIVIIVSALNIVGPIILWQVINGKPIPFLSKMNKKNDEGNENSNKKDSKKNNKENRKKPLRGS